MLVVSWSILLLLLLLSLFLFTAASVHLTVWATMGKIWDGSSRGMSSSSMFPLSFFTHCITILN